MRWDVGGNGDGDDHDFPWSITVNASSGEHVSLRACNECDGGNKTITTSIFWKGQLLDTDSHSGERKKGQCRPSSSVEATLP